MFVVLNSKTKLGYYGNNEGLTQEIEKAMRFTTVEDAEKFLNRYKLSERYHHHVIDRNDIKVKKVHHCSHCQKNGYGKVEASYQAEYYPASFSGKKTNLKKSVYVCSEHLSVIEEQHYLKSARELL